MPNIAPTGGEQSGRGVTPWRLTRMRCDVADSCTVELPFYVYRAAPEIARGQDGGVGAAQSGGLYHTPAGTICLPPLNLDPQQIHERGGQAAMQSAIMPLSQFTAEPFMQQRNIQRQYGDLTGVSYDAGVQAYGDPFIVARPTAGQSWASSVLAAYAAANPGPARSTQNAPVDMRLLSKSTLPPDIPFLCRWQAAGHALGAPDLIHTISFGGLVGRASGESIGQSYGQFALDVMGNGLHTLWEKVSGAWQKVHEFRHAPMGADLTSARSVAVWPIRLSGGRSSLLIASASDRAMPRRLDPTGAYVQAPPDNSHIVTGPCLITGARPSHIGEGPIGSGQRRDLRPALQFSTFAFAASGMVTDDSFALPFAAGKRTPLRLSWSGYCPTGCLITAALYYYDANGLEQEAPLLVDNSPQGMKVYQAQPNTYAYHVKLTLTGPGTTTPQLWGYGVAKDGAIETMAPGEWQVPIVRDLSITGPDRDPSHETLSATIPDPTDSLAILRTRASIRTRLDTQIYPGNTAVRSVLHDGYIQKADAEWIGAGTQAYPSPTMRRYLASGMGMWIRLKEARIPVRLTFANAQQGPESLYGPADKPWKITDIVRSVLLYAGFPYSMIDVPDSPIRLFAGPSGSADDFMLMPLVDVGDYVTKLLKDYLGWFLVWDGNAGTAGMWRAVPPQVPPYENLASFTTTPRAAGKISYRPEGYQYGQGYWVGYGAGPVEAWMRKRTFVSWVKPPEGNCVLVTGTGIMNAGQNGQMAYQSWMVNVKSANFLTDSSGNTIASADPTHPDYLGRIVPIVLVDSTLGGPDPESAQNAVDRTCRRLFYISCHAIKMCRFDAPLVLVWDATDPLATTPRPLRYYDAVLINGTQWLVRNCNIHVRKDSMQMMTLECEAPRTE